MNIVGRIFDSQIIGEYLPPVAMTIFSLAYLNHPLALLANTVTGVGVNVFSAYRNYKKNDLSNAAFKVCCLIAAGMATAAVCTGGGAPLLITASAINMLLFGAQGFLALRKTDRDLEAMYYFINAVNSGFLSKSPALALAAIGVNTVFCTVEAIQAIRKKHTKWGIYYACSAAFYACIFGKKISAEQGVRAHLQNTAVSA